MPIQKTTTEKEFALMAYEAHWFGAILRMADARSNSGMFPETVLKFALEEYHGALRIREQVSDDWNYVETLVRENRETDYLVWSKMKHRGETWTKALEADAREQFRRFKLVKGK